MVDDCDYDRLSGYKWKAVRDESKGRVRWYAYREVAGSLRGMHQDVLGVKPGLLVDHQDGNGLNNVRSNLRYASQSENQQNRRKSAPGASRFKGVTVLPLRYVARIKVGDKTLQLGTFESEEEAARAYDAAAIEHFREFACLNFPESQKPG